MRILFRIMAVLVFIVFFAFALKNTHEASLYFFTGSELRAPMVMLLLIFCISGAVMGILAMIPTVFHYRRELARQKKALAAFEEDRAAKRSPQVAALQPDVLEPR